MFLKLSHVAMKMMKTGKTIRHITILYIHYVLQYYMYIILYVHYLSPYYMYIIYHYIICTLSITILYVHYVGRHRHSSVRIIASPASVSILIIH